MTLIKCNECSTKISDTAKHCPECGWKVEKKTVSPVLIALIFIGLIYVLRKSFKYALHLIGVKKLSLEEQKEIKWVRPLLIFPLIFIVIFIFLIIDDPLGGTRESSSNKKNDIIDNPIVFSKGETIVQLKNRFKLFKKDNILISKMRFSDILDRNSPGRVHILTDFSDSVIIINPTNNYRYIHFIERGSRFKMIGWDPKERIAEGRIDIDIDHDNFINQFRNEYKITVSADRPGFQYEIYPQDIKYEVQKLGVAIMQNSLEHFSQNNFKEHFIDSTTFFSFFPESDLIKLFERNIASSTELLEEEYDCSVEEEIIDSVESQIATEDTELDLNENIIDNPIIKDNAKELILESLEKGIITIGDVVNLLAENKGKKIRKSHIKRLIKFQNKQKRSK